MLLVLLFGVGDERFSKIKKELSGTLK